MATHTFGFGGVDEDFSDSENSEVNNITITEVSGDLEDDSLTVNDNVEMVIDGGRTAFAIYSGTNAAGDPIFLSGELSVPVVLDPYSPICFAPWTLIRTPDAYFCRPPDGDISIM
ncbi:MAG: hypothetical protein ACI915_004509, partial [Gammaproteobacteria bacterium]